MPHDNRKSVLFTDDGMLRQNRTKAPEAGTLDVRRTTMMLNPNYIPSTTVELKPILPEGFMSMVKIGLPSYSDQYSQCPDLKPYLSELKFIEVIQAINSILEAGSTICFSLHVSALFSFFLALLVLIIMFFADNAMSAMIFFFVLSFVLFTSARVYRSYTRSNSIDKLKDYLLVVNQVHGNGGKMRWLLESDIDSEFGSSEWPWMLEIFLTPVPNTEIVNGVIVKIGK